MKWVILVTALLSLSTGFSQKEISAEIFIKALSEAGKNYRIEGYSLTYSQNIFLNPTDAQAFFSGKGKFFRGKGLEYRTESKGQLTVQTNEIRMVLDSANRLVLLFEPDSLFSPIEQLNESKLWTNAVFFVTQSDGMKKYKIEYNIEGYEYKSMEYWLDTKSGMVRKMLLQMNPGNFQSQSLEDESLENPLIVIDYEVLQKGKLAGREFLLAAYLSRDQEGKYTLTATMEGFVLDDLRVK